MISQDAFDSMVVENMEDFDLQKAEGLAETISQLKTMGKDLSHIDTTGGEGRDELLKYILSLKEMTPSGSKESNIQLLSSLAAICQDKHPLGLRNQNMMRTNGGLSALLGAIHVSYASSVLKEVFDLMTALCKTNGTSQHTFLRVCVVVVKSFLIFVSCMFIVDNRDCFEPWGNEKLTLLVNSEVFYDFGIQNHADMLLSLIQCARVLSRSECNKGKH
jgi:hypothetical protein